MITLWILWLSYKIEPGSQDSDEPRTGGPRYPGTSDPNRKPITCLCGQVPLLQFSTILICKDLSKILFPGATFIHRPWADSGKLGVKKFRRWEFPNIVKETLPTSWATRTARRQRRRRRERARRTDASGPVRPPDIATRSYHRVCFSQSQIVNASDNGIESLKLIFQEPFLFDFILLCCSFLQTSFQVIKRNDTHLTKKFRWAL